MWASIKTQHAFKTHHVPPLAPDVDAGRYLTDLFASSGEYTVVLLSQGADYNLHTKVYFRAHHQELATEGYPVDHARKARLYTRGKDEAGALHGINLEHLAIRNICIYGCRQEYGWLKDSAALVTIGGWDAKELVLENCILSDPRGWSCCHLVDGSQGGRIVNNEVGPAGQPPPNGPWADGLSIACRNGLIANNTIVDATDGAIVVFCAPGTTIVGNTILARTRNCLGGINLVDPFPFNADFRGTKVISNRVMTQGAYIHLAIGIGSTAWSDAHDIQNYGGSVMGNIIGPGRLGYGIAAAGCRDFTVLENRIAEQTQFCGSMDVIPRVSPPTPFLRIDDGWAEGTFQSEFVQGPVRYLIGVRDCLGRSMQYRADNMNWTAGTVVALRDVRFELAPEGRLVVWDQHQQGRILWASPKPSSEPKASASGRVQMSLDRKSGSLAIRAGEHSASIWTAASYLADVGYRTSTNDPILQLQDYPPYLQVKDGESILFATHNHWRHFEMFANDFIAVEPASSTYGNNHGSSGVPSESRQMSLKDALADLHLGPVGQADNADAAKDKASHAFLWLDPHTSQLVLHSSRQPREVEDKQIIWKSPNWKHVASDDKDRSKATLQGDGNFVIYGGKAGAVWASGTNGPGKNVDNVAITMQASHDGAAAAFEIRSGESVVWSSLRK